MEDYNITAENVYNWDEKGFLIGQASATRRIMSKAAVRSGRIPYACQDGSREFISLLACISATGKALPPALIYKGEHLQDTWVDDFDTSSQQAHFSTSPNGWSSHAHGLDWLTSVFERYTKDKCGRGRRLLIVDGHSSHVNLAFLDACDKRRILLLVLPPHSTHRLQPLDIGLFAPLARYYTNQLNDLMLNSLGLVSISKRIFWKVFWPAWQQAFSEKNILSVYAKTGIWPFNPELLVGKITKPITPHTVSEEPQYPETPITCRDVRRLEREYRNAPSSALVQQAFHISEKLAALHSIDTHTIRNLQESLADEKRRRKRGKKLDPCGEETHAGAIFWSPAKVQRARDYNDAKEADKAQEANEIANRKRERELAKKKRDEDAAARSSAYQERLAQAREKRAREEDEKEQRRLAREIAKAEKEQAAMVKLQRKGSKKALKGPIMPGIDPFVPAASETVEEVVYVNSRGRRIAPHRYNAD